MTALLRIRDYQSPHADHQLHGGDASVMQDIAYDALSGSAPLPPTDPKALARLIDDLVNDIQSGISADPTYAEGPHDCARAWEATKKLAGLAAAVPGEHSYTDYGSSFAAVASQRAFAEKQVISLRRERDELRAALSAPQPSTSWPTDEQMAAAMYYDFYGFWPAEDSPGGLAYMGQAHRLVAALAASQEPSTGDAP